MNQKNVHRHTDTLSRSHSLLEIACIIRSKQIPLSYDELLNKKVALHKMFICKIVKHTSLPFVWILHSSLQLPSHILRWKLVSKIHQRPEEFIFNMLAFSGNYNMSYGNKNSGTTIYWCLIFFVWYNFKIWI